jgi:hypothetical protein
MANVKPKLRTESVGVRLSPRLRYGLDLVARKTGRSISETLSRALEMFLEYEGITIKKPGEMFSVLDELWRDTTSERLILLEEKYPQFLTPVEKCQARLYKILLKKINHETQGRISDDNCYEIFDQHFHKEIETKLRKKVYGEYQHIFIDINKRIKSNAVDDALVNDVYSFLSIQHEFDKEKI